MYVDVIGECRRALADVKGQQIVDTVMMLRAAERIFCVGNGGGYAHAMHFASDLRKIAHKQAFSFDNMAELTARVNDDGWDKAWWDWRQDFGFGEFRDTTFIFSVGGAKDGASLNMPTADWGIVGAAGGQRTNRIVIPSTLTPVVEGCQSVIAHHLVEQICI